MFKQLIQRLWDLGNPMSPRVFRQTNIDSTLSPEELAQLDLQYEHQVEECLQMLARTHCDVAIRVAVFKRQSKSGAPSLLAMLRPQCPTDAKDPRLTELLALHIVKRYNSNYVQAGAASIGVVIWSPSVKLDGEKSAPAVIYQSEH